MLQYIRLSNLLSTLSPLRRGFASSRLLQDSKKCLVLYGSQTGNAEYYADCLGQDLANAEREATVMSLKDITYSDFEQQTRGGGEGGEGGEGMEAYFVVSCYGKGEPTDNAKEFFTALQSAASTSTSTSSSTSTSGGSGALDHLRYAVFGLGNSRSHSQHYNVIGRKMDAYLEELGGERLYERGEGDDAGCLDSDFEEWSEKLQAALKERVDVAKKPSSSPASTTANTQQVAPLFGVSDTPAVNGAVLSTSAATIPTQQRSFYSDNTHKVQVVSKKEVLAGERPVFEVLFDVSNMGEEGRYTTGDHVCIYAQNSDETVARMCETANIDPALSLHIGSGEVKDSMQYLRGGLSIGEVVKNYVDINGIPSTRLLRTFAECAQSGGEKETLAGWAASREAYSAEVKTPSRSTLQILERFPSISLHIDTILNAFPRLQPRFYSISSSAKASPSTVGVTLRPLIYTNGDGAVKHGVASNWISNLNEGDWAALSVRESIFHLPSAHDTPIVMVGAGTGVAPFLAFLRERMAVMQVDGVSKMGDATLIMGYRNSGEVVGSECVQSAMRMGALSQHIYAYSDVASSSTARPVFPSDSIKANRDAIVSTLDNGGKVYICGGAQGFGTSVIDAMKDILLHTPYTYDTLLDQQVILEDLAD